MKPRSMPLFVIYLRQEIPVMCFFYRLPQTLSYCCLPVLLSVASSAYTETTPIDAQATSSNSGYSLNKTSLKLMQQQLTSMLKRKILATPPVNPATALPPIVLQSEDEETPDKPTDFFQRLIAAAKDRTQHHVKYDASYRYISYPMGDVATDRGVCTDVLIRAYRKLGIDLQQLVHEDMLDNFQLYPSHRRWGNTEPDPNIDHRRVYNLQVFFRRYGKTLPITNNPADYLPGDLVTWHLGPKMPHIGIVVDEYSTDDPKLPLIVHNIGQGPKMENMLFTFPITGHYRFKPGEKSAPSFTSSPTTLLVKEQHKIPPENTPSADNSLMEAAFFLLR